VEFGRGRPGRRWVPRAALACLVLAAVITVIARAGGHPARPAVQAAPPPPAVQVTMAGRRLLGVTGRWQLLARGPDDLLRIQLAQGRITRTYVPPLDSGSPTVAFVPGAGETVIRSSDLVPGYVVPDGRQARLLAGPLAGDGPLVPGPSGTQAAWVTTGPPTAPSLSLVTLTGHRAGPVIRFRPGGPQLPATAVSDGRGYVLVTDGNFGVYDAGPGWDRRLPGTVVATGPADWLVVTCGPPQFRQCRNEVISIAGGSRRVLPGAAAAEPYQYAWPPTGVIAPGGGTAAVAEYERDGRLTVHLINLRTGATRDLGVPLSPAGGDSNVSSMTWSPDGRWLFAAALGGHLAAISARTGQAQSLGVALPAVDQVAIRA
jgi:hypothetical protein